MRVEKRTNAEKLQQYCFSSSAKKEKCNNGEGNINKIFIGTIFNREKKDFTIRRKEL